MRVVFTTPHPHTHTHYVLTELSPDAAYSPRYTFMPFSPFKAFHDNHYVCAQSKDFIDTSKHKLLCMGDIDKTGNPVHQMDTKTTKDCFHIRTDVKSALVVASDFRSWVSTLDNRSGPLRVSISPL